VINVVRPSGPSMNARVIRTCFGMPLLLAFKRVPPRSSKKLILYVRESAQPFPGSISTDGIFEFSDRRTRVLSAITFFDPFVASKYPEKLRF